MLAVCLVLIQTLVESHGIVAARTVPKGSPRPPSTPPLPPRRFFPRPVPHIHTRHPIPCHNCFGSPAAPFPATDAPLPSPLAPVYPAFGRTHPWQGQGARRRSAIALHLTPRGARPSPQPPAGSAFGAQIESRRRGGGGAGERDSDLLRAGAVVRAGLSRGQGPPLRCVLSPSDAPGRDLWFVRRARLSRDGPGPALDDRSGEDELPGGLASVLRAACVRVCARSRVRACVRVLPRPFPSCVRRKNALGLSIQNQERNRECWVSFKYEGDRAL